MKLKALLINNYKNLQSFALAVSATSFLAGCAGVTATPLKPDGTAADGPEGVRYYMPMPYLLVAELPPTPTAAPGGAGKGLPPAPNDPDVPFKGAGAGAAAPADAAPKTAQTDPTQGTTSPAPTTNTSFLGQTPQYVMKLVYLPDKSQPMALSAHTGLFGTAEMKPVLQDGWMLTSLDATADSKTAEALTALASLATASVGAAAKTATTAATAAAKGAGGAGAQNPADLSSLFSGGTHILRPGLYKFVYDPVTGQLTGLQNVVYFSGTGVTTK